MLFMWIALMEMRMSSLDGGSTDDEDLPEARLVRVEPNGSVDWTSSTLRDVSCFIAVVAEIRVLACLYVDSSIVHR